MYSSSGSSATDPDGVLVAAPGAAVEPAVDRVDDQALPLEQRAPLRDREPGEAHLGLACAAADAEEQGARLLVPVGALPDPRLALDPAAVRVGDVVGRRREDVEDEA